MALELPEQGAIPDNDAWLADSQTATKRLLGSRQLLPTSLSVLSFAMLGLATHVEWIPTLPHAQLAHTIAQYTLIVCGIGNAALSNGIAQINVYCGPQPDALDTGTE